MVKFKFNRFLKYFYIGLMRNLGNVITGYLSRQTDYAVQIVGTWGLGKTYYYKNTLQDLILAKEVHSDNSKKYKSIYISLFGLKSIEEIATKIVTEFYQSKLFKEYYKSANRKKKLKITSSILKIGLRGFLNFHVLGGLNEYITDLKNVGENVLDSNELVVCFDDLERKDSSLSIKDLTGYINSLVDEGIKVLIISNEEPLINKSSYKNLKEKIIGITIEYVPNIQNSIDNILKQRYAGYPSYE